MTSPAVKSFDVAIIGGGPSGLSAALVLARSNRSALVIDSDRPRNRRAQHVNGYLGLHAPAPQRLRAIGRQQCAEFGVEFCQAVVTRVESVNDTPKPGTEFRIHTEQGTVLTSRKVLFASGLRDQLPEINGMTDCYGVSVHHCPYCDGWYHRGQTIFAVGQKSESAMALAERLLGWTDKVIVLANGLGINADQQRRLAALGIALHEARIERLNHEAGKLQSVSLAPGPGIVAPAGSPDPLAASSRAGLARIVEGDALFFSAVPLQSCELPTELGCKLKEKRLVETDDHQCTGVPGIFVAGDADGDTQLAIVAAGEGATAAIAIHTELHSEDISRRLGEDPQGEAAASCTPAEKVAVNAGS